MAAAPKSLAPPQRLGSLDAYRGLVMVALAGRGFGISETAQKILNSGLPETPDTSTYLFAWKVLGYEFEHVQWVGCSFWDLIQPSFMFMVGVSLPFSCSRRLELGHSTIDLLLHALFRSLLLIFLGVFLSSQSGDKPSYIFFNVLAQIGLGYTFLYLLWNRPPWLQLLVAQVILVAYGAWFAFSPVANAETLEAVGVTADWKHLLPLDSFAAHWQKNGNPAARFDAWFLNLFPSQEPFTFNKGGYTTLNFIPALVTMLFGLMTGEAIRSANSKGNVVGGLILCAILGLASGWALDYFGICPLVKRIWTPSWTLFSTGWCWLILAGFYLIIDVIGLNAWSFPLKVAGMNSLLLYLMGQLLPGWTETNLRRFFEPVTQYFFQCELFDVVGPDYAPLVRCNLVLLCFWLFTLWLYRQKLFVRI